MFAAPRASFWLRFWIAASLMRKLKKCHGYYAYYTYLLTYGPLCILYYTYLAMGIGLGLGPRVGPKILEPWAKILNIRGCAWGKPAGSRRPLNPGLRDKQPFLFA